MPVFSAVAAAVVGGVISNIGADEANESNRETARDSTQVNIEEAARAREFNSAQAARQMEFQERMSNTAHQRAIGDLRAAGLNPILAATHGGASSPVGATASAQAAQAVQPAPALNKGAALIQGAQGAAQVGHTIASAQQARAAAENLQADTRLKEAEFYEDPHSVTAGNEPKTHRLQEVATRTRLLNAQARHEIDRMNLTQDQVRLVNEEIKNATEENRRIRADTRNVNANAVLRELERNEAQGRSAWHGKYPDASRERHWLGEASKAADTLGSGLNSALRLRRGW